MALPATDETVLYRIARQYYLENRTQEEIARQLGISRAHVSRLLQKCREDGIVQIRLLYPFLTNDVLEQKLRKNFGLRDAVVVVPGHAGNEVDALGRAGAYYLQTMVGPTDVLGVSWGTTIWQVEHYLRGARDLGIDVVQLMGGLANTETGTQSNELVRSFTIAFGGTPYYLSAPLYVDSTAIAQALCQGPIVGTALRKARAVTVALVGIGPIIPNASLFRSAGLSRETVSRLQGLGAVGDICGRFFNHEGNLCSPELDGCTISISFEDLCRVPCVIGVAAGNSKIQAITGALKGHLVDVLITDEDTATQVLAQGQLLESDNNPSSTT